MAKHTLILTMVLGFLTVFRPEAHAKEVNLRWQKMKDATAYNLQVSDSPEFSTTVLAEETDTNFLRRELNPGTYYLRVQGIKKNGKLTVWSDPFRLVVTGQIETVDKQTESKSEFIDNPEGSEVSWVADASADVYKVRVEKNSKLVYERETADPRIQIQPDGSGKYVVKVSPGFGGKFAPYQTVKTLNVVKVKKLSVDPATAHRQVVDVDLGKVEKDYFDKEWSLGFGIFSSTSLGQGPGSAAKLSLEILRYLRWTERLNAFIFIDHFANSNNWGATPNQIFGGGFEFYLSDRLSHETPVIRADLGYGGGNRLMDASPTIGVAAGYQFFRTKSATMQVLVRHLIFYTSTTNTGFVANYPFLDQLQVAVSF